MFPNAQGLKLALSDMTPDKLVLEEKEVEPVIFAIMKGNIHGETRVDQVARQNLEGVCLWD